MRLAFLYGGLLLASSHAMEANFSPIEDLPSEVKLSFIDYLDLHSFLQLDQVSQHFHEITQDTYVNRKRAISEGIIHRQHAFAPMGREQKQLSYFQLWSLHHQWVNRQGKNMRLDIPSLPDPLYFTNLKLGNEHALKLFYPLFFQHIINFYLFDKVTPTLKTLEEHLLDTLPFYGDQGSKNAQNALVLSHIMLYFIKTDEESGVTVNMELPPLLPLIKKYADDGNHFLQTLLCDLYLNTQMVASTPEYYLEQDPFNLHDMKRIFLLGRLSGMLFKTKDREITLGVGLQRSIAYAATGNPYLQKNMVQTFFKGKHGFSPNLEYGFMILDRLLENRNFFILAPILEYLPQDLPHRYQKALRDKLINDAMNGSKISQKYLVKGLAQGKYYFQKSIEQAKGYALRFNLSPKKLF